MDKLTKKIVTYATFLYKLDENQKNDLVGVVSELSENEKKETLVLMHNAYLEFNKKTKDILFKITKLNNDLEEYKEHISADDILDQLNK